MTIHGISAETLGQLDHWATEQEQAAAKERLRAAADQRQADISYRAALDYDAQASDYRALIAVATGEPAPAPTPADTIGCQARLSQILTGLLVANPDAPVADWSIHDSGDRLDGDLWRTAPPDRAARLEAWATILDATVEDDPYRTTDTRRCRRVEATVQGLTVVVRAAWPTDGGTTGDDAPINN